MNESVLSFDNRRQKGKVKVVLFSGGRGSRVLSKKLINNPHVILTVAINGYDDGASTGEVRRFLGDTLGPSDYRKNASRLAGELQSASPAFIELLDLRLPVGCSREEALAAFRTIKGETVSMPNNFAGTLKVLLADIDAASLRRLTQKLTAFEEELGRGGQPFCFSDCSLGNLVFAGCFLEMGRSFNAAIADYCQLLNLPAGLIENVTDGMNAFLVALDHDNRLLGSEAEIVDANKRNYIRDIYLIDRPLTEEERLGLSSAPLQEITSFLEKRSKLVTPNPRLLERITEADLIIYSPGTQHSSLLPSYLTPGLGSAIAQNLQAIKLLITNLQEDAEIPDSSAVDIINKAVYYLKEKNRLRIPTPCLITHYLINDPNRVDAGIPYIPLGRLESLEDPRLVRVANYEEGITGCHDATKVLTPFIESFLKPRDAQKIAVVLLDTNSLNKISQTILEMLRGGIQELPIETAVYYDSGETLDHTFIESLPFTVYHIPTLLKNVGGTFQSLVDHHQFDYVILFESSGMYKGEDIVNLASLINNGRLDAVWGSRRLSINDIYQSYKLRYRHNLMLGAISYSGSHILSLMYLILYGRYISDTLSGARAVRAAYLHVDGLDLHHKLLNQHLLSVLLRSRAEMFETPIQFFPISPERVRRTTLLEGLRSLFSILWWRFRPGSKTWSQRKREEGSPAPTGADPSRPEQQTPSASKVLPLGG